MSDNLIKKNDNILENFAQIPAYTSGDNNSVLLRKVVMVFGKFLCKLKMVHLMARDRIKTKSFTVFAEIKLRMILPFN